MTDIERAELFEELWWAAFLRHAHVAAVCCAVASEPVSRKSTRGLYLRAKLPEIVREDLPLLPEPLRLAMWSWRPKWLHQLADKHGRKAMRAIARWREAKLRADALKRRKNVQLVS